MRNSEDANGSFPAVWMCTQADSVVLTRDRADTDRDGWVTINYEDFMKVIVEPDGGCVY